MKRHLLAVCLGALSLSWLQTMAGVASAQSAAPAGQPTALLGSPSGGPLAPPPVPTESSTAAIPPASGGTAPEEIDPPQNRNGPAGVRREGFGEPFIYKGAILRPLGPVRGYGVVPSGAPGLGMFFGDAEGRFYRSSHDLLPPASDPNDFQSLPLFGVKSLGVGIHPVSPAAVFGPRTAAPSASDPLIRYGVQARPGIFFDTGYTGGDVTFSPALIAVDGTDDAHLRGQLYFSQLTNSLQSLPVRLQTDVQTSQLLSAGPSQAYVDAVFVNGDQFFLRNYYFRVFNDTATSNLDHGLTMGQAESSFGDIASAPSLISTGALPVGAVAVTKNAGTPQFTGIPQVRYVHYFADGRLESTTSLEDQSNLNDVIIGSGTLLHRYPIVVSRLRLLSTNPFNSIQVAGLARPMGFEEANFSEHFVTGWGVSVIGRFSNRQRSRACYFGAVGGRGVGSYIYGGIPAGIVTGNQISALASFGAYAAYQHVWAYASPTRNLSSNLMFGIVDGAVSGPNNFRRLHQAAANLLVNTTSGAAYGVEYQFGDRTNGNGASGDDHRVMIVFQASMNTKSRTDQAQSRSSYAVRAETPSNVRPLSTRRL